MGRIKVGIGISSLADELRIDGIGQYTARLQRALAAEAGLDVQPLLYTGERSDITAGRFKGSFARNVFRAHTGIGPFELQGCTPQVYHATDHRIPQFNDIPVVATLHDAIPFSHPHWANSRHRHLKNLLMRRSARWADAVVCISHAVVDDIVRYWQVPESRISVIHHGVDMRRFSACSPSVLKRVRALYNLPHSFVLFIGTLQPRKNLERLLDAHACLPITLQKATPLVIAGGIGWGGRRLKARLTQAVESATVIFTGYVADADLPALYQAATLFALPSLHEGFGLPVLEAFASKVPVLCSDRGALPEVAGGAACLVNPESTDDIRDNLKKLLVDAALRKDMIESGYRRASLFTWQETAQKTAKLYRKLA